MSGPRRLAVPRRVAVQAADDGQPREVSGQTVESVRESWLVEDRWWTERPVRRRYWEVVTMTGRNEVVYHDLQSGRWWRQR
jgi:CO dehydrogenase/acetyl-CoA synthase delta subunit